MFPVPGPISNTTSVGFKAALATMAVTTAGFLRKCCPREVLGAMRLVPFSVESDCACWEVDWREEME